MFSIRTRILLDVTSNCNLFGFGISVIFDGLDPKAAEKTYPRILRCLNRNHIGHNSRVAVINDLLVMCRHSVKISSSVTLGGNILFNDDDNNDHSIRIEDGALFGNNCIIETSANMPRAASVGSVTCVDVIPRYEQENEVIVGIPARSITGLVSQNDNNGESFSSSHFLIRMIALLFTESIIHLLILPLWIFIFGSVVCRIYSPKEDSFLLSCLSVTLMNGFKLFFCPFLGGTQWVNIFLNALGGNIHSTAIIADIDCIKDPDLITVDSYIHIDQHACVQAHINEHRRLYMCPVSVGSHSHLMSGAFILPECHLKGNNIIIGKVHHLHIIDLLFASNLPRINSIHLILLVAY